MRKINKSKIKDNWYIFDKDDTVEFKIRPFPLTNMLIGYVNKVDLMNLMWQKFNYCILDWKGIQDDKDKDLKCNEENKKFVFDWDEEIVIYIGNKLTQLQEIINPIEKKT